MTNAAPILPKSQTIMNRREMLKGSFALAASSPMRRIMACENDDPGDGRIMTVQGDFASSTMGPTLPHEHLLVDFIGAEQATPDRYDADEVFKTALPHLKRLKEQGAATLIECTPAYLGRDPLLLNRLAKASGVRIVTNTGYYAANGGKHLPAHVQHESADEIAARWIKEWRDGIGRAAIRPGFIKIGTDAGPLPEINRKLVRAAARTHLATGLTIAAHTGNGVAAMEQLAILKEEGVDPSAFIWVHAQNESDPSLHAKAAEQGAWVEFDGVAPATIDRHRELVLAMKGRGLLRKTLISHDAGWYHVGEPNGGEFRPFDTIMGTFLPEMKQAGLTDDEGRLLLEENPRAAFTMRVRKSR
jgi:phosphotriesterase-related protein